MRQNKFEIYAIGQPQDLLSGVLLNGLDHWQTCKRKKSMRLHIQRWMVLLSMSARHRILLQNCLRMQNKRHI